MLYIFNCKYFILVKLIREHISEIRLNKPNFARRVLENNLIVDFYINNDLKILISQYSVYINSVLEELLIYNEVTANKFKKHLECTDRL